MRVKDVPREHRKTKKYRSLSFLGFPRYRISRTGKVYSKHSGDWTKRKSFPCCKEGHQVVVLHHNGKKKHYLVHHLVLWAFVEWPTPKGKEACHYPDRDPTNNNADNLMWGSHTKNSNHKREHGTMLDGEKNGNAIYSNEFISKLRKVYRRMVKQSDSPTGRGVQTRLCQKFGLGSSYVSRIVNNKMRTYG